MVAVWDNLGLNNWDQSNGLTDQGVLGKLIGGLADGEVRWKTILGVDLKN